MSLSHYIQGIVPPDEAFIKMKAVWDACKVAKIRPPEEVIDFFNDCAPDLSGVVVEDTKLSRAVREWSNEYASGYEIHIEELPKHIKIIRAVIS